MYALQPTISPYGIELSEAHVLSADPSFDLYALNAKLSPPKVVVAVSVHRQLVDFEVGYGAGEPSWGRIGFE